MSRTNPENMNAIELGRAFFEEVVRGAMEEVCPDLLAQAACGRFGLGSECLGLDDAYSRDHHWGPRVDILLPDDVLKNDGAKLEEVPKRFPPEFLGFKLEAGHVGVAGLAPEGLDHFVYRAIGRTDVPKTLGDWLDIPEEDITHLINGEVWSDGLGRFTEIREFFNGYYPDPVWKRRIAHWCRYASGMGLYPIRRAVLRDNLVYAYTAFGRVLKLTIELVFLLNRTYFPYDKWLYPMFRRLPELAPELDPLILEATRAQTGWEDRIRIVERMHSTIDERMVEMGLIEPHPKFAPSPTSGYRLLEHAYAELVRNSPEEIRSHVPLWDQRFLEEFISGWVARVDSQDWIGMLDLKTDSE